MIHRGSSKETWGWWTRTALETGGTETEGKMPVARRRGRSGLEKSRVGVTGGSTAFVRWRWQWPAWGQAAQVWQLRRGQDSSWDWKSVPGTEGSRYCPCPSTVAAASSFCLASGFGNEIDIVLYWFYLDTLVHICAPFQWEWKGGNGEKEFLFVHACKVEFILSEMALLPSCRETFARPLR